MLIRDTSSINCRLEHLMYAAIAAFVVLAGIIPAYHFLRGAN